MKTAPRSRPAVPPATAPAWGGWIPLAAALVATIAFWNSLHYGLAQDAFTWLGRTRGLIPHTTGIWRTLSYDLYYWLIDSGFGLDPRPYRVASLALHALNAGLFAALALRLGLSRPAAFAAAMFFGAHYAHFDAVFVVASISEPMAATFVLLSLWFALPPGDRPAGRLRIAGATLAFGAALLSKETVVLYPAVLWLVTRFKPGAARGAVIPCAVLSVVYLGIFWATDPVGGLRTPGTNVYEARWDAGLLASWATYQSWSLHLVNLYQGDLSDRVSSHPEGWLVTALGAFLLFQLIDRARRSGRIEAPLPAAASGIAAYVAFIAPVLPLVLHAFHLYLYLPLVGLGWTLAAAWDAWVPGKARWIAWIVGAWLAGQGVLTVRGIEGVPLRETRLPFMGSVRRAQTADKVLEALAQGTAALPETLAMLGPDASSPPTRPDTTELGAFLFNDVAGALNEGTGIRLRFPQVRHVAFFGDLGPWVTQPDVVVFDYEGHIQRVPAAWLYLRRAAAEWQAGRIESTRAAMAGAGETTRRWLELPPGAWREEGLGTIRTLAQELLEADSGAAYPADDPRVAVRAAYRGGLATLAGMAR